LFGGIISSSVSGCIELPQLVPIAAHELGWCDWMSISSGSTPAGSLLLTCLFLCSTTGVTLASCWWPMMMQRVW
jgi:hypothetical protein